MRQSIKRAVAAATTAIVLGTTLVACSDSGGGGDDDTIVLHTSWLEGEDRTARLHEILDAFTDETGIGIELLQNGDELNQVYETAVLAGDQADVVLTNLTDKQLDWVESGAVVPAGDYIEEWGLGEEIPQDAIDDWTDADGNVRAIPYVGFTWPMWYNTALLEQAGVEGVPATTDELVDAAQKLRAAGIDPFAIGGSDWSGQKLLLLIIESVLEADEAQELFANGGYCDSDAAMEGIDLFVALRDAGVFVDGVEGLTAEQATAMYYEGEAAMGFMGSWAYLDAPEDTAAATTLSGLPVAAGSPYDKPTAYRGSTGGGWWISENGQAKIDQVRQLIEWVYSPESIATLIDQTGVVPVAEVDPEVAAAAGNALVAASVSDLQDVVDFAVMPDTFVPAAVSEPLYRATSVAFARGADAQAVCSAIDEAYASAG